MPRPLSPIDNRVINPSWRTVYANPFWRDLSSIREEGNVVPPENMPGDPLSTPPRDSPNTIRMDFIVNGRKSKVDLIINNDSLCLYVRALTHVSNYPMIHIGSFFCSRGIGVRGSLVFARHRRQIHSDFVVCSQGRDHYLRVRELKGEPANLR